jgi:toxin ParE1/3/4
VKLLWTMVAVQDREQIFDYIALDSPSAALAVDGALSKQLSLLEEFPDMGRSGRVAGTRELVVQGTPFIVAYQVRKDSVRILRILHGAQLWPHSL